jgi:hypothetical protein
VVRPGRWSSAQAATRGSGNVTPVSCSERSQSARAVSRSWAADRAGHVGGRGLALGDVRTARTTAAPARAGARAAVRPMPLLAPVTTIVRPWRSGRSATAQFEEEVMRADERAGGAFDARLEALARAYLTFATDRSMVNGGMLEAGQADDTVVQAIDRLLHGLRPR